MSFLLCTNRIIIFLTVVTKHVVYGRVKPTKLDPIAFCLKRVIQFYPLYGVAHFVNTMTDIQQVLPRDRVPQISKTPYAEVQGAYIYFLLYRILESPSGQQRRWHIPEAVSTTPHVLPKS